MAEKAQSKLEGVSHAACPTGPKVWLGSPRSFLVICCWVWDQCSEQAEIKLSEDPGKDLVLWPRESALLKVPPW